MPNRTYAFGAFVVGLACVVGLAGPADAQSRDETIVYGIQSDIQTYDPHDHILREGIIIGYHIFDNLLVRDMATGKVGPHVATSWKLVDPLTWEFKLRTDVVFHNGEKLTARTVKFNFDRLLNPENKLPQRANHAAIKSVEVVDDSTVRFKTEKPYPIMLERLTQLQLIPEAYFKDKGKEYIAEHPIGTGPYKFVSWKKKQEHQWVRNDSYWGPKPAFKSARVRIIPEPAVQIAELLSGGVDLIKAVAPDQISVINGSGVARTTSSSILRTAFIQLDSLGKGGKNPFQDKRVREAVNHAVNIDGIIKHVLSGEADRTATAVNPMAFGYDPSIKPREYNPEKAKKLLAEAGYPNGFEVRLRHGLSVVEPGESQTTEAIAADLAKVGIRVKLDLLGEVGPYVTQVKEGKAGPMFAWSWGYYSVFDADAILWDIFHCGEVWAYYCNTELDKLIEEGRATIDPAKRKEIYSKAQKILHDDAAHLWKWGLHGIWGVSNRMEYKAPFDEIDRLFVATPRKR